MERCDDVGDVALMEALASFGVSVTVLGRVLVADCRRVFHMATS